MHVLIIPSWYPEHANDISGCFFREQALALTKAGCRVGVLAINNKPLRKLNNFFQFDNAAKFENDEGIKTYRKDVFNWFFCMPMIQTKVVKKSGLELFERYVKKYGKPDIVHVHSILNAGLIAEAIQHKHCLPFVITEHSTEFARNLVQRTQKLNASRVVKKAARCIAVSTPFAQFLNEYFSTANTRWEVVPNIVQERFLNYKSAQNTKDSFCFLNICLLTQKKRVDLLIRAFAISFRGDESTLLTIGGDGDQRQELEALVKELGLQKQVIFLGMLTRQQVLEEMSKMDAFVLSSQYETFGVVLIEALSLGRPVIATRCGGPEHIVRESDGILVPKDDEKALASAMQRMKKNYSLYNANDIRIACIERFSEQAVSEQLIKIYSGVLDTKSKIKSQ